MDRRDFLAGTGGLGVLMAIGQKTINANELPTDITDVSASMLSSAIREGHVSCVEVMQAYLERIHRYNPVYNAIVSMVEDDELIRQAELADAALTKDEYWGWMHGMPHAIKDGTDVEGMPTSRGSPIFAGTIAEKDSLMVAKIRSEGAIFMGKTNLPEFAMGSNTYNTVFGATGCAYNPSLSAGGSSGGAACGLSTHFLPVADGGDFMGSLRNPGAFNNCIGFRPTQSRVVEDRGSDLFYQQLGTSGPVGRNSEDTYRLLYTIAGPEPDLPMSLRDKIPATEAFRPLDLRGLRIGWMGDYDGYLAMETGILDLCEQNLAAIDYEGAIVEPCKPEYDMDRLWHTWLTLRHFARHSLWPLYHDAETRKQLKPEVIWEIEGSFGETAENVYNAGIARADWFRAMRKLFDQYDFLAIPTAQVFPFPKDEPWPKSIGRKQMDTYHRWMEVVIGGTLAGLPVVNVPVGFDDGGRPMGMQILGPFGEDRKVLEFAAAYEKVTGHLDVRPEMQESA